MTSITDRLYAHTRITPIREPNRVKRVVKMDSGALAVTLHSGRAYMIAPEDDLFQAFVVYTVLNPAT